ncbi:hypothetical protein [Actinacidiphila bryophytorum]|uniref:hypothetical protein n=1 Tax=Actinacidiphila bryophytorum TaxID=1436133 RepID=UPI002176CC3B|nr:hypothetical protein [Actinacidiphila bryophytorum]UWE12052.1 hypothetical protein NYE86_27405 [Actinacidiphila bryophytorum]
MGHQGDSVEEFRSAAATRFAFLVEDAGFSGPERTEEGLVFHGPGLDVEVWFLDVREPQVTTLVVPISADGTRRPGGWLDDLYVTAGCGPAQDIPGSAQTQRAMLKRVEQHAEGLRRLLPQLLDPDGDQLIPRLPTTR